MRPVKTASAARLWETDVLQKQAWESQSSGFSGISLPLKSDFGEIKQEHIGHEIGTRNKSGLSFSDTTEVLSTQGPTCSDLSCPLWYRRLHRGKESPGRRRTGTCQTQGSRLSLRHRVGEVLASRSPNQICGWALSCQVSVSPVGCSLPLARTLSFVFHLKITPSRERKLKKAFGSAPWAFLEHRLV